MEIEKKTPEYDSDEEVQNYNEEIKFQFKPLKEASLDMLNVSKIKADLICFGTLGHASAFLIAKKLDGMSCSCHIFSENLKLAEIMSNSDNSCIFIIFEEYLTHNVYYEFSKFFFEKYESSNVIIFDSVHPNTMIGYDKDNVSFPTIRTVCTNAGKNIFDNQKPLEMGHQIKGLPADILTFCEINKIPCILYLLLADEYDIVATDVIKFNDLKDKVKWLSKDLDKKTLGSISQKINLLRTQKSCFL